ncbi:MAG: hypothetical protein GY894_09800 [Planctomycetes bacterium]|nr:hypothetical protein [Planctomycetota bacterium]
MTLDINASNGNNMPCVLLDPTFPAELDPAEPQNYDPLEGEFVGWLDETVLAA